MPFILKDERVPAGVITSHRRRYGVILAPNAHWGTESVRLQGKQKSIIIMFVFIGLGLASQGQRP